MLGRDSELAIVSGFLDRLADGPGALVLGGEAGIGKTTLWVRAIELARSGGLEVMSCRSGQSDSVFAYSGLIDLFDGVGPELLGGLPEPQRHALAVALVRATPRSRAPLQREVAVAALGVVRRLAAEAPLLLAIDDLEWLDGPSARMLGYVIRRIGESRVGLLATTRAGERTSLELDGFIPAGRSVRVTVGPLAADQIGSLIRERLGVWLDREVLARLQRSCGGNPFYALEIARSVGPEAVADVGVPLPVPDSLRELVAERVSALPPAAREAVLVTFALARPSRALVDGALRLARRSQRGVELGVAAGVIELRGDRVALSHPLLGSVLYDELAAGARRALHRRLAALELDEEERARHLALATVVADAAVAAELERAAARARARGAADAAAELGALAVRMTPARDSASLVRRMFALSMDQYMSGDSELARARWRELVALAPAGRTRAQALWHLAEFHDGRTITDNEALLERALAEAAGDPQLEAQILTARAEMALWAGYPTRAEPHIVAALALARAGDDPYVLAPALALDAAVAFYRGRGIRERQLLEAIGLEPALERLPVESRPSFYRALLHAWAGDDVRLARRELDAAREQARRLGDEISLPLILLQLAELECWLGRPSAARVAVSEAEVLLERGGARHLEGLACFARAQIEALTGEPAAALETAKHALALDEPRGVLVQSGRSRGLLGFVELALGRPERTLDWLDQLERSFADGGYREPSLYRFLPDQVEALVLLGQVERADALLKPFERSARRLRRRWALAEADRCAGVILAARGEVRMACARLERAVARHASLDQPFELARTLLVLGGVQRREREKASADRSLFSASALFERVGAVDWAARARDERRRVGLRPRAASSLTASEARIAELAAAGRRNREIAALAFVSVKSVEANLTRVYRKLGVRSRTELTALLAGSGQRNARRPAGAGSTTSATEPGGDQGFPPLP